MASFLRLLLPAALRAQTARPASSKQKAAFPASAPKAEAEPKKEREEDEETPFLGENKLADDADDIYHCWKERYERVDDRLRVEFDESGLTYLHYAALDAEMEIIEHLLDLGMEADTVSRTRAEVTPLHWACVRGHTQAAMLLISRGASIRKGDSEGYTSIIYAAQSDRSGVAHMLIHNGASVNTRDNEGHTPLHWAAYMGHLETAELLIKHGASIDAPDGQGLRPIHRAVSQGSLKMARLLVKNGATVDVSSDNDVRKFALRPNLQQWLTGAAQQTRMWRLKNNVEPVLIIRLFFYLNIFNLYLLYFRHIFPFFHWVTWGHVSGMVFSLIALVFYLLAYFTDPGFVPITKERNNQCVALCKKGDVDRVCHLCEIVQPIRSKHCFLCKRCVARFDHHCGWLGNCVGYNNMPFFLAFVIFGTATQVAFLTGVYLRLSWQPNAPPLSSFFSLLWFGFREMTYFFCMSTWVVGGTMYLILITVLQLKQTSQNITGNELANAWRLDYITQEGELNNQFDQGIVRNVLATLSPALRRFGITKYDSDYLSLEGLDDYKNSAFLSMRKNVQMPHTV